MTEPPLTDAERKGVIKLLATADPDYDAFSKQHARLGDYPLAEADAAILSHDLLRVLRESSSRAAEIDTLLQTETPQRFDTGALTIPVLVAVVFLLRTHIRFNRQSDGRWELQIEHQPADSELLTALLNKLASLLSTGNRH